MLDSVATAEAAPTVAHVVADAVRPGARAVDEQGVYPAATLHRLGAAGAFSHHVGLGGAADGLLRAVADMTEVGAACLSTAFCLWCQDALAWYLDRSENDLVRQRHLGAVASGGRLGGTGLSNPMKSFSGIEPLALKGERMAGGYRVSGRLPWVSNLGGDHLFAAIFALADGRRIMALIDCSQEGVQLAQNARFVALEGTGTYTVMLRDVLVPDAHVIAEDASRFVPRIRQGFVMLQLGMALGSALGAAELMEHDASGRASAAWLPLSPAAIRDRSAALVARARHLLPTVGDPGRAAFLEVLRLRLDGTWLALDATQAAALQLGARGYLAGSEAHRRQREAQFVAIVTPSVKHITKELAAG